MSLSTLTNSKDRASDAQLRFRIAAGVTSIAVILLLNTLYYLSLVASPIIRSDAWGYVDAVIVKWANVGFSFTDLFHKSHLSDYSLPSNKIALLLTYKYFDLDFRYEALFGFIGICVIFAVLIRICLQSLRPESIGRTLISCLTFIACAMMLISMNVTEQYTWPLVTFSYLNLSIALLVIVAAWKFIIHSRTAYLLISFSGFVLLGDWLSIMLWMAATISIAIAIFRDPRFRSPRAKYWILLNGIFITFVFLLTNFSFILNAPGSGNSSAANSAVDWLTWNSYTEIFRVIFSAGIIHQTQLPASWTNNTLITLLIALVVFTLYVRHFLSLLYAKNIELINLVSTAILIYASIMVAGIIVVRVPSTGTEYLNQTRYVFIYQLIVFALLLDLVSYIFNTSLTFFRVKMACISVLAVGIAVLYFSYTFRAYHSVKWLSHFYIQQTLAIGGYSSTTEGCSNYLNSLCNMPHERRLSVINFLESRQLNVFNTDFQWRYRLFPYDSPSIPMQFINWGPKTIEQTDVGAIHAIWIRALEINQLGQYAVLVNGVEVPVTIGEGVLTFAFTLQDLGAEEITSMPISLIEKKYGRNWSIGSIEVKR